jgi:hypothetical protein
MIELPAGFGSIGGTQRTYYSLGTLSGILFVVTIGLFMLWGLFTLINLKADSPTGQSTITVFYLLLGVYGVLFIGFIIWYLTKRDEIIRNMTESDVSACLGGRVDANKNGKSVQKNIEKSINERKLASNFL